MRPNEGIPGEERNDCFLCGRKGAILYRRLSDAVFGARGQWDMRRCPECRLLWLDPRPAPQDLHSLYENYFTHDPGRSRARRSGVLAGLRTSYFHREMAATWGYGLSNPRKKLGSGRGARLLPAHLRDLVGSRIMWLRAQPGHELLDVGCGDGKFLAFMRELGWSVTGVEPDEEAAKRARLDHGLDVVPKPLEQAGFPNDRFDVITMGNVLEHLPDALEALRQGKRILKPGGRMVILTPNPGSLGHRLFGRNWRGLEPPRHFFLYPPLALRRIVARAGLAVEELRTTLVGARDIWLESRLLQKMHGGPLPGSRPPSLWVRAESYAFLLAEHLGSFAAPLGEETLLIVKKAAEA